MGTLAFSRHSIHMKEWIHVLWARVLSKFSKIAWWSCTEVWVQVSLAFIFNQTCMHLEENKGVAHVHLGFILYSCTHGANTAYQEGRVHFSKCLHLCGRHEVGSSINMFSSRKWQLILCKFHMFHSSLVIRSESCFMRCESWTEGGKRKENIPWKKFLLPKVFLVLFL